MTKALSAEVPRHYMPPLQVIQETSAITFMVAGTCKEVVTVVSSVLIFGDEFHLVNGMGLVVLLSGVAMFNYIKLMKVKAGKVRTQPMQHRQPPGENAGAGGTFLCMLCLLF